MSLVTDNKPPPDPNGVVPSAGISGLSAISRGQSSTAYIAPDPILQPTPTAISSLASLSTPLTSAATTTSSAAAATSSAPADSGSSGPPLVAILAPVLSVAVLVPIIIFAFLFMRNRRRSQQRRRQSPEFSSQPTQTQLLPTESKTDSRRNSVSITLPSPFAESEKTKSGSLGVYDLRLSLEDRGRSQSLGMFDDSRFSGRASSEIERGPSPTLPSPQLPTSITRPGHTQNQPSWPLPATARLPDPTPESTPKKSPVPASTATFPKEAPYDPHFNTNKPLPPSMNLAAPIAKPLPKPLNSPLPPRPGPSPPDALGRTVAAALRPPSSVYDSTPRTADFPEPPRHLSPKNAPDEGNPFRSRRDSDVVSEMSFHEESRRPSNASRKDTDAISVVSAMTDKRRRSNRDTDAFSVVSALSPSDEPPINMEHFPR